MSRTLFELICVGACAGALLRVIQSVLGLVSSITVEVATIQYDTDVVKRPVCKIQSDLRDDVTHLTAYAQTRRATNRRCWKITSHSQHFHFFMNIL